MWWWSKIMVLQREMYHLSEYHLIYKCEVSLLWSFGVRVCPTISEKPLYIYICINLHIHIRYMLLNTHTHTSLWNGKPPICLKVSGAFWKPLESPRDFWPACVLRQCASHSDIPRRSAVVCRILDQFHGWQKGQHGDERLEWWNLWCNYIFLPIGSYTECSLSSSIWRVVRMLRYHDSLWDVVISWSVHRCLQLWSMAILETRNKKDFFLFVPMIPML